MRVMRRAWALAALLTVLGAAATAATFAVNYQQPAGDGSGTHVESAHDDVAVAVVPSRAPRPQTKWPVPVTPIVATSVLGVLTLARRRARASLLPVADIVEHHSRPGTRRAPPPVVAA